ncbi:MAG: histidine phosphatase family protein [Actinomycetes bacterium]
MSKESVRLVIWRHGQTDWNIENRFQGHSDIPLNSVGHYQAEHAAKILEAMGATRIIASDLIRAQQTAEKLSALTGLPVETDARLRETNGGNWEGKTGLENRANDSARFIGWISGDDGPAGEIGERRSEVALRAEAAAQDALQSAEGTVVFVTHGGTARCLLGKLLGLNFADWSSLGGLSNAQWSVLEYSKYLNRWTLSEHNAGSIPEPVFGNEAVN